MGLVFRALNEKDIALNVEENGLYSKENIGIAIEDYLNFLTSVPIPGFENIEITDDLYKKLLDIFKKEKLGLLDINRIRQVSKYYNGIVRRMKKMYMENPNCFFEIEKNKNLDFLDSDRSHTRFDYLGIFASINGHLQKGSEKDYNWISFTKNLPVFFKYYLNQNKKHGAVCMISNINGIFDGDLLAFDMSTKEAIENNPYTINKKNREKTSEDSRAINYSLNDEEVLYYNNIPKEKLMLVEPLHVDMLHNYMLDKYYFYESKDCQIAKYYLLMLKLKCALKKYPQIYNDLFDSLYVKKLTLDEYVNENSINYDDAIKIKEEILEVLNDIEDASLYKKKNPDKVRVLEKDRYLFVKDK